MYRCTLLAETESRRGAGGGGAPFNLVLFWVLLLDPAPPPPPPPPAFGLMYEGAVGQLGQTHIMIVNAHHNYLIKYSKKWHW